MGFQRGSHCYVSMSPKELHPWVPLGTNGCIKVFYSEEENQRKNDNSWKTKEVESLGKNKEWIRPKDNKFVYVEDSDPNIHYLNFSLLESFLT